MFGKMSPFKKFIHISIEISNYCCKLQLVKGSKKSKRTFLQYTSFPDNKKQQNAPDYSVNGKSMSSLRMLITVLKNHW